MKNRAKSIVRSITITIFITLFFLVLSCDKNDGPEAFFINDIKYKKVQFMDLPQEGDATIISWDWDFGDGNTSAEIDTYNILLMAAEDNELSDFITKEVIISDSAFAVQSYPQGNTAPESEWGN